MAVADEDAPVDCDEAEPPPRVEKFQTPACDRMSETCGSVSVNDRTSSLFEKIKDIRSTPTVICFAVINGEWLKAGSSAITKSSARIPPENRASSMLPMVAGRPSALLNCDSSSGLKRLASITKGKINATITRTPTTLPAIIRDRLPIEDLQSLNESGRRFARLSRPQSSKR